MDLQWSIFKLDAEEIRTLWCHCCLRIVYCTIITWPIGRSCNGIFVFFTLHCYKMLRRKPTKIEVKIEDKEELEEARRRNVSANANATAGAAALLRQFDRAEDPSSKAHRIGLSS
ncbi:hypothetical protein VNO77_43638 [Canavalia gladiata]|uniref:Uncharacterized protein n=1 Tax=Canavalia gladiata TaxID=3824 RepID=A0AAN9JWS8_CANGL